MALKRVSCGCPTAIELRPWLGLVVLAALILTPGLSQAQDWPQWRGPSRSGLAASVPVPTAWPEELEREWQIDVGEGQSSPVVQGGRVYLMSREGSEEVVRALELETGKELWRQSYPASFAVKASAADYGEGPKSTPVVGDGKLCTLGISGILSCFDSETGKRLWHKDFAGRYPAAAPPFGASMSPLMRGGVLIAHVGGHDGGAVTAFDPATGEEKWTLNGEGPGYSSPILVEIQGHTQLVTQAHRHIMGVDAENGEFLWKIPFVSPCDQNVVTPVAYGDQLIFSGPVQGTFVVSLTKEGETWKPEIGWHNEEIASYMATPVLVDGVLFGMGRQRKGQFFAIDPKTGSVLWTSDGKDGYSASLVALGHSILVLKDTAELLVLSTDTKSFEPQAQYKVADSATWAHPVPTAKGLLIKDAGTLALWDLNGKPAPQAVVAVSP